MGPRYVLGWGAVLALSVGASAGTLVLVRQAIGEGNLADPLSQSQVRSQYADALHPAPTVTRTPTGSSTSTSANPSTSPTAHRPPTSSSGNQPGQHSSTGRGGGSTSATHPHPGGSSSSTSHTSTPPPASVTRVLTSSGGSVVVRCSWAVAGGPGQVYLVSWSPAQGYSVNGVQRGPGQEAEIEFESAQSSVSVNYHCSSSGPVQEVETGGAWGGGGDDGGDPGGGGGDG